jgi:hypothetical protein
MKNKNKIKVRNIKRGVEKEKGEHLKQRDLKMRGHPLRQQA